MLSETSKRTDSLGGFFILPCQVTPKRKAMRKDSPSNLKIKRIRGFTLLYVSKAPAKPIKIAMAMEIIRIELCYQDERLTSRGS